MIKGSAILEFILKNRRGKAFKDFTVGDIMSTVSEAASLNGLAMVIDNNNDLSAIAIGFPYIKDSTQEKFLHVHTVLTTKIGDLKTLLLEFQNRFPNFTITARRRGKIVKYLNTPKLIKRLWATSDKM